jgi:hypothetical protein
MDVFMDIECISPINIELWNNIKKFV